MMTAPRSHGVAASAFGEPRYISVHGLAGTRFRAPPGLTAINTDLDALACAGQPDLATMSTAPPSPVYEVAASKLSPMMAPYDLDDLQPLSPPPGLGGLMPLAPPPGLGAPRFGAPTDEVGAGVGCAIAAEKPPRSSGPRWPISPASSVSTAATVAGAASPIEAMRSHEEGTCKPCLYFNTGLCHKGAACSFCHEAHNKRQLVGVRPSKRTRACLERRARRTAPEEEEEAAVAAQERGRPTHPMVAPTARASPWEARVSAMGPQTAAAW